MRIDTIKRPRSITQIYVSTITHPVLYPHQPFDVIQIATSQNLYSKFDLFAPEVSICGIIVLLTIDK
jgi:hypothetical protein